MKKSIFLSPLFLVIILVVFAVGSYIYVSLVGNEFIAKYSLYGSDYENKNYTASIEEGCDDCVEIVDTYLDGYELKVKLRSTHPGRTYILLSDGEPLGLLDIYVHKNGVVTQGDYYGRFTGNKLIHVGLVIYLFIVTWYLFRVTRASIRENMYQYKNILLVGLTVFIGLTALYQALTIQYDIAFVFMLSETLYSYENIALFTFPIIFLASIATIISNIKLVKKEGRTWRNMLGIILGLFLCMAAIVPVALGSYLQHITLIDVHNWRGPGRFISMFIEFLFGSLVVYFDSILVGSIIMGVKAAKHIPAFDKDYILIHGCQIKKDGSLTKLLQSRTDRAIEFAKLQKDATGKDIIFVPSGGKGDDEVISEAEAIKRYLLEEGIPEEQILMEDKSTNTEGNLKNSFELIEARSGEDAKVAFATTNYHALRAGLLANEMGKKIEGVGSKTKSYFWVNAFIREFIATLVSERKAHFIAAIILALVSFAVVMMTYISNVILS